VNAAELAYEQARAAYLASAGALTNAPSGRTGWPPGLLQDDSRELARWFAERPGARALVDSLFCAPACK